MAKLLTSFIWNRKRLLRLSVPFMLMALLALVAQPVFAEEPDGAAGAAVVRCEPPTYDAGIGETFPIDIYIEDVIGLYGIDIPGTFNPAFATINDSGAPPGIQLLPIYTFFSHNVIQFNTADNGTGDFHFVSYHLNPTPAVDGSGSLFQISFTGVAAGSFNIEFGSTIISDRDGVAIPHSTENCLINVGTPTAIEMHPGAVNEPQAGLPNILGFAVLLLGAMTVVVVRVTRPSR